MKTTTFALNQSKNWQQMLRDANKSLRNSWDFDTVSERELIGKLLEECEQDASLIYREVLELLKNETAIEERHKESWAVIKEAATVLHNLKNQNFKPTDHWLEAVDLLWQVGEIKGSGSWSSIVEGKLGKTLPVEWKKSKFAMDAVLMTLRNLTEGNCEQRIERFFNCKISDYWRSFMLFWDRIWGDFQERRSDYFKKGTYRGRHLIEFFELVIYRLENFDKEFVKHEDKPLEALDYLKERGKYIPKDKPLRKKIYIALLKYLQQSGKGGAPIENFNTIREILGDNSVFRFLCDEVETMSENIEKFSPEERGKLLLSFPDVVDRWKMSKRLQQKILPFLLAALKHDELTVIEQTKGFFQPYLSNLFKYLRSLENSESEDLNGQSEDIFKKIIQVFEGKAINYLLRDVSFLPEQKGKFLLMDQRLLESRWEAKESPNRDDLLPLILAAVESENLKVKSDASDFLKRKSKDIQRKLDILTDDLQDEDKAGEMIFNAIQFGSDFALKTILNKCMIWVASDQYVTLVDRAAQKIRHTPEAILPLINLLNNRFEFHKSKEVRAFVRKKILEDQQNPTISRVYKDWKVTNSEKTAHNIEEIYKWCLTLKERSKLYADIVSSQEERIFDAAKQLKTEETLEMAAMILQELEYEEIAKREVAVEKWITQLLSEMSDKWFFENDNKTYERIKMKLERLAVEPLSKRLPKEEQLDIRENLVKILGNIGGRVAVNALVRTVTGEERARAARQKLLSEYYLEPSKAQSEEAARLLADAVENTKKTMRLLQVLNIATFVLGAILIMGGVTIAIINEDLGSRVIGVLSGLGGLAAIMTQFLKDPLDRIQRALADLVQVQTAFTSFIWELNLNGTYIQSQYVAEGILKDFDLRQTINRIDNSMERTLRLIQVYASGQSLDWTPQLHYAMPAENNSIALFGQHLKGNKDDQKSKIEFAINHQPVDVGFALWSAQNVIVNLPPELMKNYPPNGKLWLSLIINGSETNALPFSIETGNVKKDVLQNKEN